MELPNEVEPQDIEDYIKYCEEQAKLLDIDIVYYMEEFCV
tara:strand:+ start:254 stop:373 length:120 start_codon:yes stop_codon:yes gene_type:complete